MKPTLLSFLLIISISTLSQTLAQPNPVLDTDGDVLQTGVEYYILPVFRGRGGGLTLASTRNTTLCPLDVVQESVELDNGLPLTFTPFDPNNTIIDESVDLNIIFSAASICVQTTVWTLGDFEGSERVVSTGGVAGNPGRETLRSWFGIQKFENDYKLYYCPTVCETCRPACGDIVVSIENGVRKLIVTLDRDIAPFGVMFKKV